MKIAELLKGLFQDEPRGPAKESSLGCSGLGAQDHGGEHGVGRSKAGAHKVAAKRGDSPGERGFMTNYGYPNKNP